MFLAQGLQLDPASVTVLVAGVTTVLGALVTGIVAIIRELRRNTNLTAASAEATRTSGVVRDRRIQEIHLLVNSRLLTVLRLLVVVTKKEAERTGLPDDVRAYQESLAELTRAEAGHSRRSRLQDTVIDATELAAAELADHKINALLAPGV